MLARICRTADKDFGTLVGKEQKPNSTTFAFKPSLRSEQRRAAGADEPELPPTVASPLPEPALNPEIDLPDIQPDLSAAAARSDRRPRDRKPKRPPSAAADEDELSDSGMTERAKSVPMVTSAKTTGTASPLDEEGRKGAWAQDEDELLVRLVDELGAKKWSLVASRMPGRIGKQVDARPISHLPSPISHL
jgi:hypothetical protein